MNPGGRGGVLPYKSVRVARRKIWRTPPKRYENLVLRVCPKFISTPTKRYQFNNNKI